MCSGAFYTTPIPALLIETGEMPLEIRRRKLGLKYLMKLKGLTGKLPTKNLLSQHWEFMGIARLAKTNFTEIFKSMAGEIGIMNLNVCPSICRSDVPVTG